MTKLEEKRRRLGLDNGTFAAELGISPSLWSRLQNGQREVSRGFARQVVAKWPEFSTYHAADLMAVA